MKRTVIALLVILLAHSMGARGQEIAPEVGNLYNLVKNGGFEEGEKQPAVWHRYPAKDENGNVQLRDTSTFHTGKASGLIWSVTPYTPNKPWMQWNQYGIPVEGGSTLVVSMYVKTEGIPAAGGGIHFYGEGRKYLGFVKIEGPARGDDWTHIRRDVPVPADALTMGFPAYAAEKGKTWYDDLAVIGTPKWEAVRATPAVDGRLDDACWREDRAIKTFVARTGERLIRDKVLAWLAYDNTCLYVAFRCRHAPGAKLREKATQHDGDTWLDDSVEVFLDPHHKHKDYYQFCVNCAGVVRDSHRTDVSWESGARAAVAREEAAWTVELAIPFESLGLGLDTGTVWGVNLVANDRVLGETATWSLGGFHAPGRFGNVALSPDLSRFFAPDLLRRTREKERDVQAVLKEIQGAELPPQGLREPLRLLNSAKEGLESLRRIAAGEAKLPDGGWDGVRESLAAVSETILAARAAAVNELFKMGEKSEGADFHVAIAHSLQKVRRTGPISDAPLTRRVRLDAACDEVESFQLVVMPNGKPLKDVRVDAKLLVGSGGAVPLTWNRVDYIETAEPAYPTEYVGWWPDPLLPPGPFDIAADERQPLWFSVHLPPDAKPGTYTGQVTIAHGATSISVPVELRVRGFRIPRPGTLPAPFSLYLPHFAKWWYGKDYLKMPVETYARWCKFMGEHRLTPKNIARDYITQTQDEKGLHVDLSILNQTVAPLAPKYFPPYSFNLFRTPTGNAIGKTATATDPAAIAVVVKVYVDEWKRQGLPEKVYIYGYDEPKPEHGPFLREAYKKIREVAPGYPIMQTICGPDIPELAGLVDIWCPITSRLSSPFYAERKKAGDTLWTYVACGPRPPYANFLVDVSAIDHRVLFWQARQYGATGFLYWCVCYWDGLPNAAAGGRCFPDVPIHFKDLGTYKQYKVNGDGLLAYPGKDFAPLSSIRLEVIRDGIEDYECLALLSRLIVKAKAHPAQDRLAPEVLKKAEELCLVPETISRTLTDYTKDPNVLFERRREVNDMLERVTQALGAEARN